jgi:hypothetical protein
MKSKPTLIACLILLTSCGVSGPAPTDSFCATEKPILVSSADVLTKETAREVLAHNEYGARKCNWK